MGNIGYTGRGFIIYIPPDGSEPEALLCLEEPSYFEKETKAFLVWKLMGGTVGNLESLIEALVREGTEECGIRMDPNKLTMDLSVSHTKESKKEGESHHVIITFLYVTNRKEEVHPGYDIRKVKWFPLSKIPLKGNKLFKSNELIPSHRQYILQLLVKPECMEYLRSVGWQSRDFLDLLPFKIEDFENEDN